MGYMSNDESCRQERNMKNMQWRMGCARLVVGRSEGKDNEDKQMVLVKLSL